MKSAPTKTFPLIIGILFLTFQLGFSQESKESLEERVETLEAKVATLEKLLADESRSTIKAIKNIKKNDKPLLLEDWSYSYVKGDYDTYYNISITLKNKYEKSIKLIDASVQFFDLLDESIYGIQLNKDQFINSGETKVISGNYSINQFINSQLRMKSMKKEDIKAKLVIRKIVLEDNTILNFE